MPPAARRRRSWLFRYLRAEEYFGEILFGLIMVLTITLGASVVGRADAGGKALLYAALGCNLAWGIIDGVMYLLARLLEHGHRARLLHDVQRARNPDEALGLTVLEAMSHELPVVAAKGGGHLETIGAIAPELCYPVDDLSAGAEILRTLAADEAQRGELGARLREAQQGKFSLEAQACATEAVYRSVL